mmetsp:Transcript_62223/g.148460  ORF Transcript_62223/g.148460 Transcript_62223/m.148460 type:complete len:689 (-) Transcript_62223:142-2208(-)
MADIGPLQEENARLKRELEDINGKRRQEQSDMTQKLQKEKSLGKAYSETIQQKQSELDAMRSKMVKLTRQLDAEVTKSDVAMQQSRMLERKLQETGSDPALSSSSPGRGSKSGENEDGKNMAPTKLMRVIDQWMRQKDLQQALLKGASINDQAFSTLVQVFADCPSLQTVDVSYNQLTMDSCSDVCNLITTAPNLSFISLEGNLFSLRSIGYFMTAVMERQNMKKLTPLDLLDLQGNEGLVQCLNVPPPEALLRQVNTVLSSGQSKIRPKVPDLITHVMRALWRFLHDTGHPQVKNTMPDEVSFHVMDKMTIRKMEAALMKILLVGEEEGSKEAETSDRAGRSVTADLAFVLLLQNQQDASASGGLGGKDDGLADTGDKRRTDSQGVQLPPIEQRSGAAQPLAKSLPGKGQAQTVSRADLRDPFSDLKAAFEPPKEKLKTFNLKQIVTRNGTVLMSMLERLLENTEIDARDVETEQTLLEYACQTGNVGLAKLCYRRGANLSQRTKKGDTPFNIVTRKQRYDIMEFLHMYGVKVNSADSEGKTALHMAAANDDVDAVCRLLEWGADINLRDKRLRTPLHVAAAGGHSRVTMLLLEVGADMNAKDEKEYTAVAHAEANNHFGLMDRLVTLGGKGHGLSHKKGESSTMRTSKSLGELTISAQMLKNSSLGRIGKVKVQGLPDPPRPFAGR